jgi:hypothetical protein
MNFALDPRITLATGLAAQPGVYALLLGSGASTGAGIPTGWGVVENLVRKVAAAANENLEPTGDWEAWWQSYSKGEELGYSSLLKQLASTAPARQALLKGFFEPSADDREDGLKVPGPAHRAIAELVARGTIRVIITTNFDRLIEQALEAEGVMPQVISTDAAFANMEPLQHTKATVIKLHGDYANLEQRNTVEELSKYPKATSAQLGRVLDEYGLVVSGWSGEWDHALVAAIEASSNRRYPFYWTARSELGAVAKRLTARGGVQTVSSVTADDFFPDLLARVEAVESLTEPPASLDLKLARLKRALPNPIRHLEVRDLFEAEMLALRTWVTERPRSPVDNTFTGYDLELDAIAVRFQSLFKLFAMGILLDRDRQHSDLWVWVVQQALNVRNSDPSGAFTRQWDNLAHYPALLLLRAGTMASVVVGHEDVIVRIASEPTWSTVLVQGGEERPAHAVIHLWSVLDPALVKELPRWIGRTFPYPASHLVRSHLQSLAVELTGGAESAKSLLSRMEYRMALADQIFHTLGVGQHGAAGGEFLASWRPREADDERTAYAADFRERGGWREWIRGSTLSALDEHIDTLDKRLKKIRNEY